MPCARFFRLPTPPLSLGGVRTAESSATDVPTHSARAITSSSSILNALFGVIYSQSPGDREVQIGCHFVAL
jgi:hypothetical protein